MKSRKILIILTQTIKQKIAFKYYLDLKSFRIYLNLFDPGVYMEQFFLKCIGGRILPCYNLKLIKPGQYKIIYTLKFLQV